MVKFDISIVNVGFYQTQLKYVYVIVNIIAGTDENLVNLVTWA